MGLLLKEGEGEEKKEGRGEEGRKRGERRDGRGRWDFFSEIQNMLLPVFLRTVKI